jgi:hypothetical protein
VTAFGGQRADAVTYSDGGTHSVGPGPASTVFVINGTTVNIQNPTQIQPPPATGGGGNSFIIGLDAIEAREFSHVEIFGGQFEGADATYTGNVQSATAAGGDGLRLFPATAVIHSGSFIGGDGQKTVNGFMSSGSGGQGASIGSGSMLTIYDGFFQGGVGSRPSSSQPVQSAAIELFESTVHMHGGTTNGRLQLGPASILVVYGSEFAFTGQSSSRVLTGKYANGQQFTHNVSTGFSPPLIVVMQDSIVISTIPEPCSGALVAVATVMLALRRRRASVWGPRN